MAIRSGCSSRTTSSRGPLPARDEHSDSATSSYIDPPELFKRCFAAQERMRTLDVEHLKLVLTKALLCGAPIFPPAPIQEPDDEIDPLIYNQLWKGSRYDYLIRRLRVCSDNQRLSVLVRWLKSDKICEPEQVIGWDALSKTAKKHWARVSESEFKHASRVNAWLPYFKQLLDDRHRSGYDALVKARYHPKAIRAADRKRSPVPAAAEFLAIEFQIDAGTLRNAYSRMYRPSSLG